MQYVNGIPVDGEKTFGELKMLGLRTERYNQNDDGTRGEEVVERIYELRSKGQKMVIAVGIPAAAGRKEYGLHEELVLVHPTVGTVASAVGRNRAEITWYIKAEDLVPKTKRPEAIEKPSVAVK